MVTSEYVNGQIAARMNKTYDDNPYFIVDARGFRRATNVQMYTDWNLGFRDETDKIYKEKGGFDGEALIQSGAFRRKSNRYYGKR